MLPYVLTRWACKTRFRLSTRPRYRIAAFLSFSKEAPIAPLKPQDRLCGIEFCEMCIGECLLKFLSCPAVLVAINREEGGGTTEDRVLIILHTSLKREFSGARVRNLVS